MDRISVTDSALFRSVKALQAFVEKTSALTEHSVALLQSQLPDLDTNFRTDVLRYIEAIKELQKKIAVCVEENASALGDRFTKLVNYQANTYKPRIV